MPDPSLSILGVCFEIDGAKTTSYGLEFWRIVWGAIDPGQLRAVALFEGDTEATLQGRESVYCIAFQSADQNILEQIAIALEGHPPYMTIAAEPHFRMGTECAAEPLAAAGLIDANGHLSADAHRPKRALADSRGTAQVSLDHARGGRRSAEPRPSSEPFGPDSGNAEKEDGLERGGKKRCAVCGHAPEPGAIRCANCGSGVFSSVKGGSWDQRVGGRHVHGSPVRSRRKWWEFWKKADLAPPEDAFADLVKDLVLAVNEANQWGHDHGYPLFKEYPQYRVIRRLGKRIYRVAGFGGMQEACRILDRTCRHPDPSTPPRSAAEYSWRGIGGWLP